MGMQGFDSAALVVQASAGQQASPWPAEAPAWPWDTRWSRAEALETAEAIGRLGAKAMATKADVSNAREVAAMVEEVTSALGCIDVLVNNAVFTVFVPFGDIEAMKEADWYRLMRGGVSVVLGRRAALRGREAGEIHAASRCTALPSSIAVTVM